MASTRGHCLMRFGNFTLALSISTVSCVRDVSESLNPATYMVIVVRARGLEPPILTEPDPKSGVSANSTTRAAPANAGSL